jgi:hypothetical protein
VAHTHTRRLSDEALRELVALRGTGLTYEEIADQLNEEFSAEDPNLTGDSVSGLYTRYQHVFAVGAETADAATLKASERVRRNNSKLGRDNRKLLGHMIEQEDVLTQLSAMVDKLNVPARPRATRRPKTAARRRGPERRKLTAELLVSDVHMGKLVRGPGGEVLFDRRVCERRLEMLTTVVLQELERKLAHYQIDRFILAMLGDMIENSLMHGKESMGACEFENPEQVRWIVEAMWTKVLCPVYEWCVAQNVELLVLGITGNHDRQDETPTFNLPGQNSLSWLIYQMLRLLTERSGMKVTWTIPEGVYTVIDIYGTRVCYEHGDRVRGDFGKKNLIAHLTKRSAQLGMMLKGLRVGHIHEYSCYDNGTVVVNASVPGMDSYADVNGYRSVPGQVISYYVETQNRDTSYWYSFLVNLETAGEGSAS